MNDFAPNGITPLHGSAIPPNFPSMPTKDNLRQVKPICQQWNRVLDEDAARQQEIDDCYAEMLLNMTADEERLIEEGRAAYREIENFLGAGPVPIDGTAVFYQRPRAFGMDMTG